MSKKIFIGKVVSDKAQNSVVVAIERMVAHKKYGKLLKRTKKIMADKNGLEVMVGEMVKIEETRPISKSKNFRVTGKENK